MFDNELKTKENEVLTKNKIEPQHIRVYYRSKLNSGVNFLCLDEPDNIHESGLGNKGN